MPEITVAFDAADEYEQFMGRWTRAVGGRFLDWLAPAQGLRWLDVGCGTGAFTQSIQQRCAPASVHGVDPAPAQIEYARKQAPEAAFDVADAIDLPFADATFDVIASALVINFIPDRAKAFSEMRRVAKPGGIVSGYLWQRGPEADHSPHAPMQRAIREIGFEAMRPPMAPESMPDGARAALAAAGFSGIAVSSIEVSQTYDDFDDYWTTSMLPLSPIGKSIRSLNEEQRTALRKHAQNQIPPDSDGKITLAARAVAFKAIRPD